MAFRFALAPLLRLRQGQERQLALRLSEASNAVARARTQVERMDEAMESSARSEEKSLRQGRTAAEMQFAMLVREQMKAARQILQNELARLELDRQTQAIEYQRAYQAREVLESLRARQQHIAQQKQQQQEQRDLDATHLLQLWRKRLG
jgi:flagellar export protein FliJ